MLKKGFILFLISLLFFSSVPFQGKAVELAANKIEKRGILPESKETPNPVTLQNKSKEDIPAPPVPKKVRKELETKRSTAAKTFDNGDGTYTQQLFSSPINLKKKEKMEEISSDLVQLPNDSGELTTQNTDIHVNFSKKMKKGNYVSFEKDSHTLSYSFLEGDGEGGVMKANDVKASYEKNQISFQHSIPQLTIRNIVLNNQVKEDLILDKYAGQNIFRFKVSTDLSAEKQLDGRITFSDSSKQVIFTLPKPFMTDSNIDPLSGEPKRSENVEYDIEKDADSWILTVTANPDWLKDSSRQFPVYIDPTTSITSTADTFVSSAYPTTNYAGFWDSSAGYYALKVGLYDSTTGTNYAFVKQNLSALDNAVIDSSTFNIYTGHSYYPTIPNGVWLDEVNGSWTPGTLTWNNMPSSANISSTTVNQGKWASFNVTNTVQAWVNKTKTNNGFKLHMNGNGQPYWKKFYSGTNSTNKPYLSVNYHFPSPNAPTGIAYSNGTGSHNTGYLNLNWNAVAGATGYKVWIYNGIAYESFIVGNVTSWSTKGKGIWPTEDEINTGRYILHQDNKGAELPANPSPVYQNAGGSYGSRTNYAIRISAVFPGGESDLSAASVPIIPLEEPEAPTGVANTNVTGNSGYIDVQWAKNPEAAGYKVWIFNGKEYEAYDVGDVDHWTTQNKGIWPTESEIASGGYVLHHDNKGTELASIPSPVYKNSGGNYPNNTNYWFRVSAYKKDQANQIVHESNMSVSCSPTIPRLTEFLGTEGFWPEIGVQRGIVNAVNGNFVYQVTDFNVNGNGPNMAVSRTYNSHSQQDGVFGIGWSTSLGIHLVEDTNGDVLYTDEDGTVHRFPKTSAGTYNHPNGVFLTLTKTADGFTLADKDQKRDFFDSTGKWIKEMDDHNQSITLNYNASNQLASLTDQKGREMLSITYRTDGKVDTIKNRANQVWTYVHSGNLLISVKDPENGVTQYGYTDNVLTSLKDPNDTAEKPVKTVFSYINNQLTTVKDSLDRVTTLSYDAAARKVIKIDPNGKPSTFEYSIAGNLLKTVVDPSGENLVTSFTYESNNLIETKDSNTNRSGSTQSSEQYSYDQNGNVTKVTDPIGSETYQYNSNNDVTRYTDLKGQSYSYLYAGADQISSSNPAKVSNATVHDEYGNVSTSTKTLAMADNLVNNPGMERTSGSLPQNWSVYKTGDSGSLSIDTNEKESGAQSLKLVSNSTQAAKGVIAATQVIDIEPKTTYTFSVSLKTSNLANVNAFLNVEHLDANGNRIQWTDNRYGQLTKNHDWTERQLTFTTPSNGAQVRVYLELDHDSATATGTAWFDQIQLEKGEVSSSYNAIGNSGFEQGLSSWNLSLGTGTLDSSQSFDGGQSLKMVRSNATDGSFQYYQSIPLNQVKAEPITVSGMSRAENVSNSEVKDANQDYSVWVDAKFTDGTTQAAQAKFTLGTHEWQRAAVTLTPTNPISYVNVYVLFRGKNTGTVWFDNIRLQNGRAISSFTYDSFGYLNKSVDPLGNQTIAEYDKLGNKLTETDPKGNQKIFAYDNLNRLLSVSLPGYDIKMNYKYDKNGNTMVKKATSLDGSTVYNQTKLEYDAANQLSSVTDPLQNVTKYAYDSNGNMTDVMNPDGTKESYVYDGANRNTEIKWNGTTRYRFSYDANGNETKMEDLGLNETESRVFDPANRLTGMTTSRGSITWVYDENNNVTNQTINHSSGTFATKNDFNLVNQNTLVTDPAGRNYRFDFDENGNLKTFLTGNGAGSTFLYDDNNRVTHLAIGKKDGTNISTEDYKKYDKNGNRIEVNTIDSTGTRTVTYEYDEQNQLLSETYPLTNSTISYTYDPVGNRKTVVSKDPAGTTLTTNYQYNASNQLISANGTAYFYDKNGNLVDDGDKLYVWDTGGHLTQVKKKSTGSVIADYAYDKDGRRTRKTVNGVVTNYIYDGNSILVLYETNGSNQITRYYTYSASGLLLSMTDVGGGTYFYHNNAHGDVIAVTDTNGNTVASYTYDAWGNILSKSGTFADQNPYRYGGYRYDTETGFYYLIARYYNPIIGRFFTMDPDPGDSDDPITQNGYTYANNNPIRFIDPEGNKSMDQEMGPCFGGSWGARGRWSGSSGRSMAKARPNSVVNALSNFKSRTLQFGNKIFKIAKSGLKHILERHHPKYWNGTTKAKQSFFKKDMSIDDVVNAIESIMKQNRNTLISKGTTGKYQIVGKYNGKSYVVGLNNGRVGQFYPQ